MMKWKDNIVSAFIERYPASAAAAGGRNLRIPANKIFAGFDKAAPDERESFLEAAEALAAEELVVIK
ncbi:MAG: hypothetical protein LBV52_00725, partial [Spirochaetaceae bacterium]|nr:hypothetical protein [Spirochaetaceae bacterium]